MTTYVLVSVYHVNLVNIASSISKYHRTVLVLVACSSVRHRSRLIPAEEAERPLACNPKRAEMNRGTNNKPRHNRAMKKRASDAQVLPF